jgi:hypothetical protein
MGMGNALTYSIPQEFLWGTIDGKQFAMKAVSGGVEVVQKKRRRD